MQVVGARVQVCMCSPSPLSESVKDEQVQTKEGDYLTKTAPRVPGECQHAKSRGQNVHDGFYSLFRHSFLYGHEQKLEGNLGDRMIEDDELDSRAVVPHQTHCHGWT